MVVKSPQSGSDIFKGDLQTQRQDSEKEQRSNYNSLIDYSVRNESERAKVIENKMALLFKGKQIEVTNEILAIKQRHLQELKDFDDERWLVRQKKVTQDLLDRFNIILEVHGSEPTGESGSHETDRRHGTPKIDSKHELAALEKWGLPALADINMVDLMMRNGFMGEHEARIQKEIDEKYPDTVMLIERITTNKVLTEDDWSKIMPSFEQVFNGTVTGREKQLFTILFAHLNPAQRLETLDRLGEQDGMGDVVVQLYSESLVSRVQAGEYLAEKLSKMNPIDPKAVEYRAALAKINSKKVQAERKEKRKNRKKALKNWRRSFGHKNDAKDLLTFKGMAQMIGLLGTATIVVSNTIANPLNPLNPGTIVGVILGAGILETTNSRLVDKPSVHLARMVISKPKADAEAKSEVIAEFQDALTHDRKLTEFYYNYAPAISEKFAEKLKSSSSEEINLTFENTGLDADVIAGQYPGLSKTKLEETMTEFARKFNHIGYGVSEKTYTEQREFINAAYSNQGKAPFNKEK